MDEPKLAIAVEEKGLRHDALSFASNVVIGVASAAPAYSLASALGTITGIVTFGAPLVLLAAFFPMLCVAAACFHLNRIDPDCGTTFTWVTRAMGPYAGWLGGWAVIVTNVLVMPSLAVVAAQYAFRLIGIEEPAPLLIVLAGLAWIAAMTAVSYHGVEGSAQTQKVLLTGQLLILVLFAVMALLKVYHGGGLDVASPVSFGWFRPEAVGSPEKFTQALLVAVFIYWGWDTGLSVNEETERPASGPGFAALTSNVLLVFVYVLVAVAALAFAGPDFLAKNSDDVLAPLGLRVLGPGLNKLLIVAVLFSASACTLTSILPNARTALAMARAGALPSRFGTVHPRYMVPGFATLVMGGISMVAFVGVSLLSQHVLEDTILALGLCISFYYALTAFSCVILLRSEITKSPTNMLSMGVLPFLGGMSMCVLFVMSCTSLASAGSTSVAGVGGPLVIGFGSLLLGIAPMALMRARLPAFFTTGLPVRES